MDEANNHDKHKTEIIIEYEQLRQPEPTTLRSVSVTLSPTVIC